MNTRLTTGLLACLIMPLFVGCATSPSLIRGQSPVPPSPASIGELTPVSTTAAPSEDLPFLFDQKPAQMMRQYVQGQTYQHGNGHPQYCPDCYKPGQQPHWDGEKWCHNDGSEYWGWAPHHMYQHMYKIPQNMTYPQNPSQGAVTVYPYYTHKGPDDFFYTGK